MRSVYTQKTTRTEMTRTNWNARNPIKSHINIGDCFEAFLFVCDFFWRRPTTQKNQIPLQQIIIKFLESLLFGILMFVRLYFINHLLISKYKATRAPTAAAKHTINLMRLQILYRVSICRNDYTYFIIHETVVAPISTGFTFFWPCQMPICIIFFFWFLRS